ncbi:MAG: hypothetical protein ACFFCS_25055, partial [Candidatus Hodarchaeota archaeon]
GYISLNAHYKNIPEDISKNFLGKKKQIPLPHLDRSWAVFSTKILEIVNKLKVDDDTREEVLRILRNVPPVKREKHLAFLFGEDLKFDESY